MTASAAGVLAVRAMPQPALVCSNDARVVAINALAEAATGLKPEEAVMGAVLGEDARALADTLAAVSGEHGERPVGERHLLVRFAARPGYRALLVATPWRLLDGAVLLTFLPRDDGHFRALADSAPVLVWTSGLDGMVDFVNAPWLAFTGRDREGEQGEGWLEGVHPEDRERCRAARARAFAERQAFEVEYRLRRFDGEFRWVLDRGSPRYDASGEFLGFIGSCVDITERKSMQVALQAAVKARTVELQAARAHAEALAALADALARADTPEKVAAGALDALGPVLKARQMIFVRLEGGLLRPVCAWGTLSGPLLSRFKEASRQPFAPDGMTREIVQRKAAVYTSRYDRENYALNVADAPAAIGGAPVLDEAGQVQAVIGVERDPGEGEWTEPERDLMRRAAETVGQALARQKVNAQLVQQARTLQERNAEQETFIYTVSHDLRAPLLSIRGMSELLGDAVRRHDDEESAFLLSRVNANAERMERLLGDLLKLSRAMREAAPPEDLDLGDVMTAILADVSARVVERGLSLRFPDEWPRLHAAHGDAYHLLSNLVGNAVKYARGRVEISWNHEGGQLHLNVDDDGPGIPEPFRERVFELFQQAPNASKDGNGVGLAIVKRIATRLGGQVQADASPLGGARLHLQLPLAS